MKCPECGGILRTYDTRQGTGYVARRRGCVSCSVRFATEERVVRRVGDYQTPTGFKQDKRVSASAVKRAGDARRRLEELKDNAGIDES